MWPPRRSDARSGSSRFTRALPLSEVRRRVSGITSAEKPSGPTSVAVRQTPFTATESPSASSAPSEVATRSRPSCAASTVPTSTTSPVNTASPLLQSRRDQHVVVDDLDGGGQRLRGLGDRLGALALDRCPGLLAAGELRRDEPPRLVHLAGVEEGARQPRAALEQQR